MSKSIRLAISALLVPAALVAQQQGLEEAAATITQDDYAWRVGVIAHDSMQGRDTPSPGLDMTAEWIASEFRRMGLRGGAEDGGFIQRYPLRSVVVDAAASHFTVGDARLAFGEAIVPLTGTSSDVDATGGLVLLAQSENLRASLAGGAADGNHAVLIRPAEAPGGNRALFQAIAAIRAAGALSVIVANTEDDGAWAATAARALRASVSKGWGRPGSVGATFAPVLQIRSSVLADVVSDYGADLSQVSAGVATRWVDDPEVTLSLRVASEEIGAPNVVGILDGSDPELKEEYVVYSGHMDHVGIGTPDEKGDSIWNGADDDASGTIAVVEVAEAMAALPVAPKRSMIFLLVSGEEKGLWGSEWYAENPSVPVENLVANLNADMVGRNWTDTIVAIGKEHSDLGETLNRVNGDHPELRMTAIDDIWPEERFYFRSDHYNFARKGVPVLFFFNGTHEDYHGRDDEPEKIDSEKAARISKLMFYLGVDIGNAAERPKWNPESYARIVSDR